MDVDTDHVSKYIQQYRKTTLSLVSSNDNCTHGTWWVWLYFGQCLELPSQMIGFGFGLLALPLWTIAHVLLYSLQRRRSRSGHRPKMLCILLSHWLIEVSSCVGALLAHQLASQVVFALSAVVVDSMIGLHWTFFRRRSKSDIFYSTIGEHRSWCARVTRCFVPAQAWIVSAISVLGLCAIFINESTKSLSIQTRDYDGWHEVKVHNDPVWITGYVIGCMAAVLHWLVEIPEVLNSYRIVSIDKAEVRPHVVSVLGDTAYFYSVLSQSTGLAFVIHTLPWTLDRMGQNGIHIGIILQRFLLSKTGRHRSLSGEDTELLISSGSELEWSSGESEIIWSSDKPVPVSITTEVTVLPKSEHICTEHTFQILSDTDVYSDDTKTSVSKSVELFIPYTAKDSTEGVVTSQTIDVLMAGSTSGDDNGNLKTHISSLDQDSRLDKVVQWFRKSLGDSDISGAEEEYETKTTPLPSSNPTLDTNICSTYNTPGD